MKTFALSFLAVALFVLGVVFAGSVALATPGPDHKEFVCHPVEGKGETGTGWNLIPPDKASSHIDENGNGKHTRKDGRTDAYQVNGFCPGDEPTETSPTDPLTTPTTPATVPTETEPTATVPTETIPTEPTAPTNSVPTETVPTETVPTTPVETQTPNKPDKSVDQPPRRVVDSPERPAAPPTAVDAGL
jgi:hypothetical protein